MEHSHNLDEEDEVPSQANHFLKQAIDLMVEAFKNLEEEEVDTSRKTNEELLEEEAGRGKENSPSPRHQPVLQTP